MNVMLKCRLLQKVRDDVDQCGTIKLVIFFSVSYRRQDIGQNFVVSIAITSEKLPKFNFMRKWGRTDIQVPLSQCLPRTVII